MTFTLGFSPCPNDTFIFDALVNKKIDTGDLDFEVHLEDVQTLNQWAIEGRLDISKVSYGVLPKITAQYGVLHGGGALGKGVGPLLISRQKIDGNEAQIQSMVNKAVIAIPGADTTAHFLFSMAFPEARHKKFMRFDEIENWVLNNGDQVNIAAGAESRSGGEDLAGALGVIIHENRFTYTQKGLHKVMDLGDYWEKTTGYPIPLGGIVMQRKHEVSLQRRVEHLIRASLQYAFDHYPTITEYVRCHAQEMNETVMRQHIDLYVNEYSLNLGESGKAAVLQMMNTLGMAPYEAADVFVPNP